MMIQQVPNKMRVLAILCFLSLSTILTSCASQPDITEFKAPINLKLVETAAQKAIVEHARRGDVIKVKAELERGESVNTLAVGDTPFSAALKNGKQRMADYLLELGADWKLGFDDSENTALMVAAVLGANDLVRNLLIKGADVNQQDKNGYTALVKSAIKGQLSTIKVLENAGADLSIPADDRSVLMHVVAQNNMLLTQLLIDMGADLNYRSSDGQTVLLLARQLGLADMDLLLVQSGARP